MTTLQINLHDGQIDIFNDPTRFKIVCCGRRWGKTTLAAYVVIVEALQKKDGVYFLISPTYSQTSTIWRMILRIIPRDYVDKIMEGDKYIKLKNGAMIFAKSGDNPDALRGEGLDGVVLDEAAMLKREVWEQAIRPALADKKGWAVFISTPKGKNWYYEMYLRGTYDENGRYKSYHFTSYDNPYVPEEELDEMIKGLPEMEYKQEILAEFIEGGGAVFRNFEECIGQYLEPPLENQLYYVGADLGRHEDFTVLTVGKISEERIVYLERFNKTSWDYIKDRIKDVANQYNGATVFIDSTGMGEPIYDDLAPDMSIVGIKITQPLKIALVTNLALMLENKRLKLPEDKDLKQEFQAYTFQVNNRGSISYGAPSGFHDDIVMSVALAAFAMNGGGCATIGIMQDADDVTEYDMEDIVHWEDLEDVA